MHLKIGNTYVGDGHPCYIVGEIGINHNGDLKLARQLIRTAAQAGCNAVKFQKRTLEVVYTQEELAKSRESVFGSTNGDLKRGLEFGEEGYLAFQRWSKDDEITWFASCWDEASVDFIDRFGPPAYKIASASLTDDSLLRHTRATGKPIILSTGMSTIAQIDHAVEVLGTEDLVIMHAVSVYPCAPEIINLKAIPWLRDRYRVPVGYSGHETGLAPSLAAVAIGACMVERHITMDRSLWGSDQSASLEPGGLTRLVRDIRCIESAMSGDGVRHNILEAEKEPMKKLRRVQ